MDRYQAHRSNTVRKLDRVMTLSRMKPNELNNQMDAIGKRIKSGKLTLFRVDVAMNIVGHIEDLFKGADAIASAKSRSGDLGARIFAAESDEVPDVIESGSTLNDETEDVRDAVVSSSNAHIA